MLFITPPKIRIPETDLSNVDTSNEITEEYQYRAISKDLLKAIEVQSKDRLVLKNITNQLQYKESGEKKNIKSFKFPEGGWVCLTCQNYNFCGRVKCNRCGKYKTKDDPVGKPKHLLKKENDENDPSIVLKSSKNKKHLKERVGDWLCLSCRNVNFAFRQQCNRCKL